MTMRKPASELVPGDQLLRRKDNVARVHPVESVGEFVGDKNRAMVAVKAGAMVFHFRQDEQVEIVDRIA